MRGRRVRGPIAMAALAMLAMGCGAKQPTRFANGPDPARFAAAFTAASGVKLVTAKGKHVTSMSPALSDVGNRFGTFTIAIAADADARKEQLEDLTGEVGARAADGTYETDPVPTHDYGDGVLVKGELLLGTGAGDSRGALRRVLDEVVVAAKAGRPDQVPAAERPCAAVGIEPVRGKEGTCHLAGTQVTVVNAGTRLETPAVTADLIGVETTNRLPLQYTGREPRAVHGRLLIARLRLLGVRSVRAGELALTQVALVVGRRRYSDDQLTFSLDPSPIAVGPGDATTLTVVFELPPPAVAPALRDGQLTFSADPASAAERARAAGHAEGRIRLAGAPRLRLPATVRLPDGS